MSVQTISKNGKRVPASEKGKAPKKGGAKEKPAAEPKPAPAPATKPDPSSNGKAPAPSKRRPAAETMNPWPASVCARLSELKIKRDNAIGEEANMVRYRKTLDDWFTENGDPGDSPRSNKPTDEERALHAERLNVYDHKCREYVRCKNAIEAARSLQRWLADKVGAIIGLATEGKLRPEQLEDEVASATDNEPPMPLFHIPPEEQSTVPDGSKHRQNEDGSLSSVDEKEPNYVKRPIGSLVDVKFPTGHKLAGEQIVSDRAVACLKEAGLKIIRDINNLDLPGLSPGDVKSIEFAIDVLMEEAGLPIPD